MGRKRAAKPDLPPPLHTRSANRDMHPGLPDKSASRRPSGVVQAERAAKAAVEASEGAARELAIQQAATIEDELIMQQQQRDEHGNNPPKAKNLPPRAARSKANPAMAQLYGK